jgi:hypothetical protein
LTKSAISMIESGDRGMDHKHLAAMVHHFKIDPRYFFDLIDEPTDASLDVDRAMTYADIVAELRDVKKRMNPTGTDEIAYRVSIDGELRDLVTMVRFLDGQALREIKGVVYGYLQGKGAASGEAQKGEASEDTG